MGHSAGAPAPYEATHAAAQSQAPVSTGLAIAALLLNVLVIPGLGSLIGGRTQEGIWQLVLTLGAGIMLLVAALSIVGILLWPVLMLAPLAGWIWGLITGIQLVQRAS